MRQTTREMRQEDILLQAPTIGRDGSTTHRTTHKSNYAHQPGSNLTRPRQQPRQNQDASRIYGNVRIVVQNFIHRKRKTMSTHALLG